MTMSKVQQVKVPDIGDFKDVPIIEVMVKPGDRVKAEDALISLETDKAAMEVPSPSAGVVKTLAVKVGDKVSAGSLILTLEAEGMETPAATKAPAPAPAAPPPPPAAAAAPRPQPAPPPAPAAAVPVDEAAFVLAHASPSIRRFARELGVDLGQVKGSGPKSRILKEDVQAFVKQALAAPRSGAAAAGGAGLSLLPWPQVDFAKFGPVETRPLSRIKKLGGANLARNWVMIPHVTHNDEADITELEAFRKESSEAASQKGVKMTLLAFLIKASVSALKAYPEFNASLDSSGENLVLKKYYHIGFAADTPNGLVVPVLKNADQKDVFEIAKELGTLSALAREGKLKPGDMQGATFTISSLGGIGGTGFTPIINAPEVAILGVSRSLMKPVYKNDGFVPRLMLPLSLSFDHRVIDGAVAARFAAHLAGVLSDVRRLCAGE